MVTTAIAQPDSNVYVAGKRYIAVRNDNDLRDESGPTRAARTLIVTGAQVSVITPIDARSGNRKLALRAIDGPRVGLGAGAELIESKTDGVRAERRAGPVLIPIPRDPDHITIKEAVITLNRGRSDVVGDAPRKCRDE